MDTGALKLTAATGGVYAWQVRPVSSAGSDAAALAFLGIAVALFVVWLAVLITLIRVRSDRELPVAPIDFDLGVSADATRFRGGTIFAVDGHRYSGSYPFGEIVFDRDIARIRLRLRSVGLQGERVVRREEVEAVRVGSRIGIPYVEFVDDVRRHGITRFYGGKTLVRALADRGWPVPGTT